MQAEGKSLIDPGSDPPGPDRPYPSTPDSPAAPGPHARIPGPARLYPPAWPSAPAAVEGGARQGENYKKITELTAKII